MMRTIATVAATAALLGFAPGVVRAAPTHDVQIDGSALFSRMFVVLGVTSWLRSDEVQTVQLHEDTPYRIRTTTGAADFTFTVDSAGKINYGAEAEWFLDGAGGTKLTLVGVDTTVDARYLSGSGVLISDQPPNNQDWLRYRTVRLLPGSTYSWQQSSGVVVPFTAGLRWDGTWFYDQHYDVANGGYIGGNDTKTLTFYGRTLLIDARAAGGTGVSVQDVWGLPFSYSGTQTVVLLPASPFRLQVRAGESTNAVFAMADSGDITFDPAVPLAVDRYDGTRRLTVTAPL
ncbi:hypothetical protein ACFQ1S_13905 [Kibdelosporangium lantanae]|uniref:Uncharacterized protein n=1 Tax=Kibdelosporangium lantanae TaxID=1497396 RepID=A0ABW3MC87_9PSEU